MKRRESVVPNWRGVASSLEYDRQKNGTITTKIIITGLIIGEDF